MLELQDFSSFRLVSYADMILHDCPAFYDACHKLSQHISELSEIEQQHEFLAKSQLERIVPTIQLAHRLTTALGIDNPTFTARPFGIPGRTQTWLKTLTTSG
jgi:hypothetical protein